jgi:streptogramin lyase
MRANGLYLVAAISFALILGHVAAPPAQAQSKLPPALSGKVSSAEEGAMEGVVVSAKKGIVTTSVVTDDKGQFSFPADRLEAGDYALSIRANGYDLEGPKSATVAGDKPATLDVKLVKTKRLAAQLTNQEWITSVPGTDDEKKFLFGCTNCHSVERIVTSTHTAEEFLQVVTRMAGYSNNSFFLKPQLRAVPRDPGRLAPNVSKDAAYLASINKSADDRKIELKTLPRVKGEGTKVIITEYDLPRKESQPHDVIVDADGMIWYTDFGGQFLGRLNPKTLEYKEFPVPVHRAEMPKGSLDLEVDPQGNYWMALMFQGGVAKFDKKSEKFETMQLSAEFLNSETQQAMVGPTSWTVDNKLWLQDPSLPGVYRVDMTSGKTEQWKPYEKLPKAPHSVYGIYPDAKNNLWFLDFGGENVGKIDAASGEVTLFPTPTKKSRPRRGRFDNEGRLWFAEFGAEKIGVFDTKTEQFKEWSVPTKFFAPYDAVRDKEGKVWTAGMNADRVLRLDPETGKFVEYPLPRYTNVRRVFVDDTTAKPTFWIGNNHGAALIKVEPQD